MAESVSAGPASDRTDSADHTDPLDTFEGETVVDPEAASQPALPDAPALVPGSKLGRYEVIDLLGRGGMGAVYRAYDPELDRTVALKLLLMGGRSKRAKARLQREAQAIARLSHPNVVQVFDVGREEEAGGIFIAMEFVDGPTLKKWLARKQRSWREIASVFADAGEGLLAAHREGLVHRDFKPDNVLLDGQDRAKVVDFGLAKGSTNASTQSGSSLEMAVGESEAEPEAEEMTMRTSMSTTGSRRPLAQITQLGSRIGTPAYMPPEQIHGGLSDPRADQFSFAVALYEALWGHLPFDGNTPEAYAFSVLEGRVRPVPRSSDVPVALQNAILRALSTSPARRFSDLEPLLALLRDDPRRRRLRYPSRHGRHRAVSWRRCRPQFAPPARPTVAAAPAGRGAAMEVPPLAQ